MEEFHPVTIRLAQLSFEEDCGSADGGWPDQTHSVTDGSRLVLMLLRKCAEEHPSFHSPADTDSFCCPRQPITVCQYGKPAFD